MGPRCRERKENTPGPGDAGKDTGRGSWEEHRQGARGLEVQAQDSEAPRAQAGGPGCRSTWEEAGGSSPVASELSGSVGVGVRLEKPENKEGARRWEEEGADRRHCSVFSNTKAIPTVGRKSV